MVDNVMYCTYYVFTMSGLPISPETYILTRGGWKNYQDYVGGDLKVGEDIYTYEPSSKTFKWEPLVGVVLHGDGPLVKVNLLYTVMDNKYTSLTMGLKVPWVVEVVRRSTRYLTGYDGVKLMDLDKSRRGIGESKEAYHTGTTYYLLLGEIDNLVTHRENDNRVDMTDVTVGGGGSGITWTPYNTNETVVVKQGGMVFCVGTLSLRDGMDSFLIPQGNNQSAPIALNGDVIAETKAVRLGMISGFSPNPDTQVVEVVITSLPPASEGLLYYQGNPVTAVPLTLPIEEAKRLIYIPDRLFLGISSIQYDVVNDLGQTSALPGTIDVTVTNSMVLWQATEATLYDVKVLLSDLPNQVLNASITNFPTDYGTDLSLQQLGTKLDTLVSLLTPTPSSPLNLSSGALTGVGSFAAGYLSLTVSITSGPVTIGGITYNVGDKVSFPYVPGRVYPAIPYDLGSGSVEFMGVA